MTTEPIPACPLVHLGAVADGDKWTGRRCSVPLYSQSKDAQEVGHVAASKELPRVRRHGKRAWELVRQARSFILVDAQGDYYVDRGGWANRPGNRSVRVERLLDPAKKWGGRGDPSRNTAPTGTERRRCNASIKKRGGGWKFRPGNKGRPASMEVNGPR